MVAGFNWVLDHLLAIAMYYICMAIGYKLGHKKGHEKGIDDAAYGFHKLMQLQQLLNKEQGEQNCENSVNLNKN